jgi:hypothetical protein
LIRTAAIFRFPGIQTEYGDREISFGTIMEYFSDNILFQIPKGDLPGWPRGNFAMKSDQGPDTGIGAMNIFHKHPIGYVIAPDFPGGKG